MHATCIYQVRTINITPSLILLHGGTLGAPLFYLFIKYRTGKYYTVSTTTQDQQELTVRISNHQSQELQKALCHLHSLSK